MKHCCKNCDHVRTAREIGLAGEESRFRPEWLYCGMHPPYSRADGTAVGLPSGDGLENMACFAPPSGVASILLTERDLEELNKLIEWRGELLRAAPTGAVARIDISSTVEQVHGWLGRLRELAAAKR